MKDYPRDFLKQRKGDFGRGAWIVRTAKKPGDKVLGAGGVWETVL